MDQLIVQLVEGLRGNPGDIHDLLSFLQAQYGYEDKKIGELLLEALEESNDKP